MKLISVNYHYIRPSYESPHPGIQGILPDQFEDQLNLFSRVGDFVGGAEIRAAIRGQRDLPDRGFLITFDDGLREQYEWAWPILQKNRIPAIFFVNSGPIENQMVSSVHKVHLLRSQMSTECFLSKLLKHATELGILLDYHQCTRQAPKHYVYDAPEVAQLKYFLTFVLPFRDRDLLISTIFNELYPGAEGQISRELYMREDQIQEIGRAGCIGSHCHEHLPLGLLDESEIRRLVQLSVGRIAQWVGEPPYAMSYPYGNPDSSSETAGRLAAEEGIEFCFTMERAANRDLFLPMHLARFDYNDLPGGKKPLYGLQDLFDSVPDATWFRRGRTEV